VTTTRTSKVQIVRQRRALRGVTKRHTLTDGTEVEGGLELKVGNELLAQGVPFSYGSYRFEYSKPSIYKPDWVLLDNGIIVETKGWFPSEDRTKHKLVKASHPDLDIRFVFSRSASKIGKKSSTTYAMWCDRYGFIYADGSVPQAWIDEPPEPKRIQALSAAIH
jgi:hypothetical protein